MRKALTSLLLAAVALTLVAAQAQDSGNNRYQRYRGGESRSETRQQRSEQRAQRREESSQATRDYDRSGGRAQAQAQAQVQVQQQVVQQQQVVRQQADRSGGQRRWSGRGNGYQQQAEQQQAQQQQTQTQQAWSGRRGGGGQSGGGWQGRGDSSGYQRQIEETREASRRSAEGLSPRYQQQAERNQQRYERDRYQRSDRNGRNGQWSSRDNNRGGYDRNGRSGNWDRNWRNDNRYDWQRYRYANRSLFSSGRYYAPYRNYRYNRLSIGLILGSAFYADQYWLSDPWQYRLPPAYPGTQWVRYYDDVLLVDIYSGEVVDVIYDFFY